MTAHRDQQVLDLLERREDALLGWGVVDGGFEEQELVDLVDAYLLEHDPASDAHEVIESMQASALLIVDRALDPPRWRTRSAEAVRLAARLRQVFPTADRASSWERGVPLVADFRYQRRPRAYPRRDQDPATVATDWLPLDAQQEAVLAAMTRGGRGTFDLSGFQVRSTRQVLAGTRSGRSNGVVVGAGTGSGKTLAFYLPAFMHLSTLADQDDWARGIAVYPRNELLKDQFTSAFAAARRVDAAQRSAGGRSLRLGAYYGAVPHSVRSLEGTYSSWEKVGLGYRCPYLTCPGDRDSACAGDLLWLLVDVRASKERLSCTVCSITLGDDVIALTRQAMVKRPPDLVFTTTEMLNRSLSDAQGGTAFGVGTSRAPVLMLLDEIHTYSGATGAQAAMVLRRWKHRVRGPVTFVGLSATLVDAAKYFADLTGLAPDAVSYVEPEAQEMEYEGAEHLLALRSDPTTGASVLSTTIQSSMLLARIIDPPGTVASLYGSKTFVFTDDLDVTNRLYYDLLDAEGQRLDGKARPVPYKESLASLRDPALGGGLPRRLAGQSWDLPQALGHPLDAGSRLRLGRTSSQDAGVDKAAQLIIATASLEVGFDDPAVGAVLQHKSPRDIAQFVQRKGRAGRDRGARPWTLIVLSDYGRDRTTYEAWEALFDPLLPARSLPVRNRAVLRMHAVQAVLDWLCHRLKSSTPQFSAWRDLASPPDASRWGRARAESQERAARLLERVLEEPAIEAELTRWIAAALQLSSAEVNEVLWHPPRPVLLAAVPTLLRRLRSQWTVATRDGHVRGADLSGSTPLPDFFPSNLFTELSLPETTIHVPAQQHWEQEGEAESMGTAQALREFAPGRVSRRFATRTTRDRHWLSVPLSGDEVVNVDDAFPQSEVVADVDLLIDGVRRTLALARPHSLALQVAPEDIRDSSNSQLRWFTQILEQGRAVPMRTPRADPLAAWLRGTYFHLHAEQSHVEMRRAAVGADATVQFADGTEVRRRPQFIDAAGVHVAVGAVYDVDAVRLDLAVPERLDQTAAGFRGLRSAYLAHVMKTDQVLLTHANVFQIDWLHEALEIMLVRAAVEAGSDLSAVFERINPRLVDELVGTMDVMFQRLDVVAAPGEGGQPPARLKKRLATLLDIDGVRERIAMLVPVLWQDVDADFQAWLRRRILATLGQAAALAARQLCPEHDPEGLLVDVEPGVDDAGEHRAGQVWLSERSIGGGGLIEALASRLRRDPLRFSRLMRKALQPSPSEIVDHQMRRLVRDLTDGQSVLRPAVTRFRAAETQDQRVAALALLRAAMADVGVAPEHAVVAAVVNRLLRPGTSEATDAAVRLLVDRWEAEELRLGLEIEMRTWAFLSSAGSDYDSGLAGLDPGTGGRERRLDALRSLLWPRGWRLRAEGLNSWNPFADLPDPAPEVARAALQASGEAVTVDVSDPDAERDLRYHLARDGVVLLAAGPGRGSELAARLVSLTATPVDTEFLQLHPRTSDIEVADGVTTVRLELTELAG